MLNIKKILNALEGSNPVSELILKFGFFLSSFLMTIAISLAAKQGYDYERFMLHNFISQTSVYIFFLTVSGSILFEYLLSKKKNEEK